MSTTDPHNPDRTHNDPAVQALIHRGWAGHWNRAVTVADLEEAARLVREADRKVIAPKGCLCPACQHSINVHRAGGCNVVVDGGACECVAPFGRLPSGDPDPTS